MNLLRTAFSLAEVLFALLVLSIGILSILALFPVGIRAQDQVRYQMYASIKAMELSDALAQHNKNFSDRVHEMTGPLSGQTIVEGGIYGSLARFDAENVWAAGGQNGVYPVPVEIARRLDSPGDEIQRVLDQGSYLFYHDPRPVRGFSLTEANNPSSAKTAPELQRLVFAVVGAPQQNALPQHPCIQGPVYLLYPFSPQGVRFDKEIRPKKGTDEFPSHKYVWEFTNGFDTKNWEGINWEIMASARFVESPWRDGIHAFRNLCYFGWTPIEFKLTGWEPKCDDPDDKDLIPCKEDVLEANGTWTRHTVAIRPGGAIGASITDPNDGAIAITTPITGSNGNVTTPRSVATYWSDGEGNEWHNDLSAVGAGYVRGYRRDVYDESPGTPRLTVMDAFLDPGDGASPMSFKDFVNNPGLTGLPADPSRFDTLVSDVIGSGISNPTDPDPKNWVYRELGTIVDPRLPSLQQRYLYRWLALKLWRDVTVGSPLVGKNPLVEEIWLPDGTYPDAGALHAARVFALSHLADAAVRVGGMRLPMVLPGGTNEDVNKLVDKAGITNEGATDAQLAFPGSTTDVAGPRQALPDDVTMGKVAHENALRWAIAYANRFPHDNLVPRPANRQVMMDRALWQWDLFDAGGNALRNNAPNTWQGAAMSDVMPGYKVLPRPGIDHNAADQAATGKSIPLPRYAPGMQIAGNRRRYAPDDSTKTLKEAQQRWFGRMAQASEPTFDVQSAGRASRYHLNLPFSPQDRMRQIVYWAVDWKGYEDSESAPSAPHGAEQMSKAFLADDYWGHAPTNVAWNDFDPSESPLIWFGRNRQSTYASSLGPDSGVMFGRRGGEQTMTWSKQTGSIIDQFDIEGINHTYGLFGADRDGNGVHTIGSIKASTRLRAIEVARFNYYDPVVWCHVRK